MREFAARGGKKSEIFADVLNGSPEGNALSLLIPPLWSRRGTGKKGGNLVKAAAAAAYYKGRIHREREKEEEEGCLAAAARS